MLTLIDLWRFDKVCFTCTCVEAAELCNAMFMIVSWSVAVGEEGKCRIEKTGKS